MYYFLQKFHSGWAYLVLLILLIVIISSVVGFVSKKEFTATNRKLALFGLISAHIQLLIGLVLWVVSPLGKAALNDISNSATRLTALEHPLINIVAIVLITIGWSKHKNIASAVSIHKNFAIFYGLALILILSRIPWNLWL